LIIYVVVKPMVGPSFYQVKLGFEPLMITFRVVEVLFPGWLR